MAKKQSMVELVQEIVERGATAAEDIHKSIADLPLKIIEDNGILREPVKEVRRVQDRAIGAVYDLVRRINRRVSAFASEVVAKVATGADVGGERAAA